MGVSEKSHGYVNPWLWSLQVQKGHVLSSSPRAPPDARADSHPRWARVGHSHCLPGHGAFEHHIVREYAEKSSNFGIKAEEASLSFQCPLEYWGLGVFFF